MAHSLLIVIYSMIRQGTVYTDLGANYLDERHRKSVVSQAVRRIETLGCNVVMEAAWPLFFYKGVAPRHRK